MWIVPHKRKFRGSFLLLLLVCGSLLCPSTQLAAAQTAQPDPNALQAAFGAAAREFGVHEHILLAVAYNLSRWEHHAGAPSVAGGYSLMHLTDAAPGSQHTARGDDVVRIAGRAALDHSWHTLEAAAALLGIRPELLKRDPVQNLRGGAALLAQYARQTVGKLPVNMADWYGAVAMYSGSPEEAVALDFANLVYATIRQGAARTTSDGQALTLVAQNVAPNTVTARSLRLRKPSAIRVECPDDLPCAFIPAAYQQNNPADLTDYGNYDFANRPADGLAIHYIVIHNTEIDYNTTLRVFQSSSNYVSTHYLVRAADGQVAQLVRNKNVAWHAGNWYVNGHAIGIEHEGVAIEGASWYSEPMYRASARLVAYLSRKYGVPLDRAHIIGHDEIPGPTGATQAGMHWDPGPFWDWAHYMQLLDAPISGPAGLQDSAIVTINPDFATNRPALTYCYDADCRDVPSQPANFVYLHTAPEVNAPLISNSYIGAAPTRANNWANKALTGQQFYRVERQGDWDAIYFSGQKAWFYNPGHNTHTLPASGVLITPKAGLASIPVYGRAYPEESAYPTGIITQTIMPIYDLPAGQYYVATDWVRSSYYSAPVYAPSLEASQHVPILGQTTYYRIFFNHRFAFVKASDVDVSTNRPRLR